MKNLLFPLLVFTFSTLGLAQNDVAISKVHPFPRKLTDLPAKTKKIAINDSVLTDTQLLLNDVTGPIVLRICVTKQDSQDMSYLNVSLSDATFISEEYLNNRQVSKKDDFVLCTERLFRSVSVLDGKSIRILSNHGVGRSVYVEAYTKKNPALSWPILVKNGQEDLYDSSYMNIDMIVPQK